MTMFDLWTSKIMMYEQMKQTWSIVWFAPVCRSSTGLSAESMIIGTLLCEASTTAGNKLATAVPEDVITTAGDLHTIQSKGLEAIYKGNLTTILLNSQQSCLHWNHVEDAICGQL